MIVPILNQLISIAYAVAWGLALIGGDHIALVLYGVLALGFGGLSWVGAYQYGYQYGYQ